MGFPPALWGSGEGLHPSNAGQFLHFLQEKRLLTEFQAGKKKPLLQGREEKEFHEFCTCTRELWGLWEGESSVVLPSAQGWQHPLALLMDVPAHQAPRKEKFRDEKLPHSRRTLPSPAPLHPEEPPLSLVYSKQRR